MDMSGQIIELEHKGQKYLVDVYLKEVNAPHDSKALKSYCRILKRTS